MIKLQRLSGFPSAWLNFIKVSLIAILISFLTGCPSYIPKQISYDQTKNAQYYLSQAENVSGNEKINWQLLAIRALLLENNVKQAVQLFNQLPQNLDAEQLKEKTLLEGEIAVKTKQKFDFKSISPTSLSEEQTIRYYKINIDLDGLKKDYNAQLHDYIELEKYGSVNQRHDTINNTWNFLTNLSDKKINQILIYADDYVLQGWIDLLYIYKSNIKMYAFNNQDDIDADAIAKLEEEQYQALKNAVSEWQIQYSGHPAATYLPRDIYGEKYHLPDAAENRKIALFLPLSGKSKIFGETIRLGYQDAAKASSPDLQQDINFYDTNSDSIENLIIRAKQQGAQLIVGPLLKQNVQTLLQSANDIPVLALNKIEDISLSSDSATKICFFALSPEDEAKDAAQHIYNEKKKQPLLIIPHNNLGERVAKSFAQQWNIAHPTSSPVYVQYFDSAEELSKKMNSGVGIELEGVPLITADVDQNGQVMPKKQVEFDAIYIYASHEELTLIKSMLEMKSSAGNNSKNTSSVKTSKKNIPALYASSRSNIANTTTDFRYDMDQLQLSDIHLIIKHDEYYSQLPDYIKNDYSLARLYAMGFDAWALSSQFDNLVPYKSKSIDGKTGKLSVANQCDISRKLSWIRYQDGSEIAVD